MTVSNYFSASNPSPNRGLTMQTQDGHTLSDAGVLQLVSAMAAFAVPAGSETDIPPDIRQQLEPSLATAWQTT